MTIDHVTALLHETIRTTLIVASPILAIAMIVGLGVSILQAATQVNEQTLAFVPKIVAVLGTLAILFPWIMRTVLDFATHLLDEISRLGGPGSS